MNVPIELQLAKKEDSFLSQSLDLSLGGLSFLWPAKLSRGSLVQITIPVKQKLFQIKAKVVSSKEHGKSARFRTGVCFQDTPSAFKAKLAEEVLQILEYRKSLSRQLGYELSEEDAAKKWVNEYAGRFPYLS